MPLVTIISLCHFLIKNNCEIVSCHLLQVNSIYFKLPWALVYFFLTWQVICKISDNDNWLHPHLQPCTFPSPYIWCVSWNISTASCWLMEEQSDFGRSVWGVTTFVYVHVCPCVHAWCTNKTLHATFTWCALLMIMMCLHTGTRRAIFFKYEKKPNIFSIRLAFTSQ